LNLGDVLRELGDTPLKGHVWTSAIVSSLNAILPSSGVLTEDSSGRQSLAAMVLLPEPERDRLLSSEVDLLQGTLTVANNSVGVGVSDVPAESFHNVVVQDLIKDPPKTLALIFGSFIVVIAIVLAVVMSVSYTKTGKAPDTSLFTTLIHALIDLLNAFAASKPAGG
jgi:hypothetical protein